MGKIKRRSEWDRFKKTKTKDQHRAVMNSLGDIRHRNSIDNLIFDESRAIKSEALRKEEEIRNSSAPPSISDRHYPKELTITKNEETK
jgi:hypothetical protein